MPCKASPAAAAAWTTRLPPPGGRASALRSWAGISSRLSRAPGSTTFHFTDASPTEALQQARQAAAGLDVRIGGGPATIRAFLAADLIDYLHIVVVPIVLGRGERLWDGLDALEERYRIEAVTSPSGVTHLTFTRQ